MEKKFGKGKQPHLFFLIMNSNYLQIVCGPIVVVPDSFPNSQGQSVSMKMHK